MSAHFFISVVIPFYNAESHIEKCLDVLLNQDFIKPFEIIMIDDASTDNSLNIIKNYNISNLRMYSLTSNSGPSAARNLGLKKAKGEYIFFLDVDDTVENNTLTTLYNIANDNACDLVICDFKRIENSQNQRANSFIFPADKELSNSDIIELMWKRLHNPNDPVSTGGIFGCNRRLIRESIIRKNNIFFEEELRYLEDETFGWDILAFAHNVRYVRKQLYSYYVHPNVKTALSEGLNRGFKISYFKLVKSHIQNSLKKRGFSVESIKKLGDQAYIFFIINALVSISQSIIQNKVELEKGIKSRRKIIGEIISDSEVSKAIVNYSRSQEESKWIPRAIYWRSRILLEFACTRRANEILSKRKKY